MRSRISSLNHRQKTDAGNGREPDYERVGKLYCDGRGTHGRPWRFVPPPDVFRLALWVDPPSKRPPEQCPECAAFYASSAGYLFGIHVEDMESIGTERRDPRVAGVNLGLPGKFVEAGRDGSGKMHYDYRPAYSSEVNSAWKAREIAAQAGLTMLDVRKRVR